MKYRRKIGKQMALLSSRFVNTVGMFTRISKRTRRPRRRDPSSRFLSVTFAEEVRNKKSITAEQNTSKQVVIVVQVVVVNVTKVDVRKPSTFEEKYQTSAENTARTGE